MEILEKVDFNMDINEQISVPKYELVMVLKENEDLRSKISKYKSFIQEMKEKMGKPSPSKSNRTNKAHYY